MSDHNTPPTMAEAITWHHAQMNPPDSDTTVMVSISGGTEPTWLGWQQAGVWHDATTGAPIDGQVVSWAEMPEGFFPEHRAARPNTNPSR